MPTPGQWVAAMRHVGTFAAGIVTAFGLTKSVSPEAIQAAFDALGQLGEDLIKLVGILTPVVMTIWASRSASPKAQIAAVAAQPGVEAVVVKSQAVADISGEKVIGPADISTRPLR